MLRKLLPVVLSLAAFLGGAAGGEMLRGKAAPEAEAGAEAPAEAAAEGHGATAAEAPAEAHGALESTPHASAEKEAPDAHGAAPAEHGAEPAGHGGSDAHGGSDGHGGPESGGTAWFEFPQQFFVPILYDGRLDSTMIMSLSVEMPSAARETVYAHELKLRDALLRQLLIHANTGGFDGNFTTEAQLRKLRGILTTTAQEVVPEIAAILIGDIARQER